MQPQTSQIARPGAVVLHVPVPDLLVESTLTLVTGLVLVLGLVLLIIP
ncbi:MAG: hypothetical protein HKN29_07150 [Rhodothermales bacterium]|nr:hypothetical protein [Rhodothermales bacterium]